MQSINGYIQEEASSEGSHSLDLEKQSADSDNETQNEVSLSSIHSEISEESSSLNRSIMGNDEDADTDMHFASVDINSGTKEDKVISSLTKALNIDNSDEKVNSKKFIEKVANDWEPSIRLQQMNEFETDDETNENSMDHSLSS